MTENVSLRFDEKGLIPAVVQDADNGAVLMVAWMNREAFDLSRKTGYAHYFSRSRQRLWKKGETSGNVQEIREIRIDCDQATLLLLVRQHGGSACHTGHASCFYRTVSPNGLVPVNPA